MKPLKRLAQYYVDLLVKLGLVRFSMLLAFILVALAVVIQVSVTMVLKGRVSDVDIIRSVFFGLIITPWAVYFLTVVVEQLEDSRRRLKSMVVELRQLRLRDIERNDQLKENIHKLNQEIEDRKKAEQALQGMMTDLENEVFEREKTQYELSRQSTLMRSFLDASPDVIYYRNTKGEFSGCNKAFEELTGKTESDLIGLKPEDIYPTDVAVTVTKTDKLVVEGQEATYDFWLEYPTGKKAYFEFRKLPLYNKAGQHMGLVGFGRDITQHKVYQDALEKASRDKTTFISTISHELRTPLNGIVGLSRMLLESNLSQEQQKHMQTIHVSAVTLGHIFNDIIDLDKHDRSRLELFPEPIDFPVFVDEIESISSLMAQQKGLRFDLERLSLLPEGIYVDATRFRQVLWNLISNAIKFTKEGGVSINVSSDFDDEFAAIEIEIEDTGVGIPESEIDNIFAMYYQVKSGKDNLHAVGTGIGLAVSQELIRRMGGHIDVISEEGFGSTFTVHVRLPIAKIEKLIEDNHTLSKQSLRIYMVEDVELNITVARSILEKMGHTVDVAMLGQEAIDNLQPENYDLILLDIQLPDMTGFDIASHLRSNFSELPPIVALTANVMKDKKLYLEQGMNDVISKPLSVSSIRQVVDLCINNKYKHNDVTFRALADKQNENTASKVESSPTNQQPSAKSKQEKLWDKLLDIDMLTSYIEIVGKTPVYESIAMFEKMMPEYIEILDSNLLSEDQAGITSEAHKIKGAASAIGLKHIQQVAQKAQTPEEPMWWGNISSWVDEIKTNYHTDITVLKDWLTHYEA